MKRMTVPAQPSGARLERSLRKRGFQTDRLTLSIARNLRSLERFAERYELNTLLTPRARGTFAAMSCEECARFIEFLQLSLHVGRESTQTRERWLSAERNLTYLAAVVDRPHLIEGRARAIFQAMSPEAQRLTAMMLLAAWQVARRAPQPEDAGTQARIVDRMVRQLNAEITPNRSSTS